MFCIYVRFIVTLGTLNKLNKGLRKPNIERIGKERFGKFQIRQILLELKGYSKIIC